MASLRVRLVLLIGGIAVAALTLLRWVHVQQERALLDAAKDEVQRLAALAAGDYQRLIDSTELLLTILARVPEVKRHPHDGCAEVLRELQELLPAYANLGVVDASGVLHCSALPPPDTVTASDRSWFQRASARREFVAGDYQVGIVTRRPTINFAYPLEGPDGNLEGVVYAALDLNSVAGTHRPEIGEASLTLVDENGTVLARSVAGEEWIGRTEPDAGLIAHMLAEGTGAHRLRGLDGEEKIFAFTPVQAGKEVSLHLALGLPERQVLERARMVAGASTLGLLALALLTLGTAWLGSGWLLVRRISRLREQALRLSGGDLSARSELAHGPDEVGQLAAAFDTMAEQLQEAVRTRDDFLSVASHELKSPLTSLGLNLQLMSREIAQGSHGRVGERTHVALRQIARLSRLMESLLEVRRLDDQELHLRPEEMDLCALVGEVVERMREQAESVRTELRFAPCDAAPGSWDPLRIDQAVTNLLSNALKYGKRQPVEVAVAPTEAGYRITIRDQGVGIPKEDQARMFERFERARTAKGIAGFGLGLYVTRQIVVAHGGTVEVQSEEGQGCTVTIELPRTT